MTSEVSAKHTPRRSWPFARDVDGRLWLGVLSGLAGWIGASPGTLRILFVVGAFFAPRWSGIAAYLALAIVMPVAIPSEQSPQPRLGLARILVLSVVVLLALELLFALTLAGAPSGRPLGTASRLAFGVFVIAVGVFLLFGRRRPTLAAAAEAATLTTSHYGNVGAGQTKVPMAARSGSSTSIRIGLAAALLLVGFPSTRGFCLMPIAVGLIVACAFAIRNKQSRAVLIPVVVIIAAITVLTASTGEPINRAEIQGGTGSKTASPFYADHFYQYRYVGSVRQFNPQDYSDNIYANINEGFVAGDVTIHVQAPDNNRVIFDGRMTAGAIEVRYVDSNDKVLSEVSSQSGMWTTKHETFGDGPKVLHVTAHGGVGRLILDIDRSEWSGPVCTLAPETTDLYECG